MKYKFRVSEWFNFETGEVLYGVQVRMGRGKWRHAIDSKEIILRKVKEDAEIEMQKIKESAAERGLT